MPTEEEEREVLAHRTIEAAEDMPEHGELREFTVQLARDPVTNSLGMQFKHNHIFDKVCISVVKPRGPADVSGQINVGDHPPPPEWLLVELRLYESVPPQ